MGIRALFHAELSIFIKKTATLKVVAFFMNIAKYYKHCYHYYTTFILILQDKFQKISDLFITQMLFVQISQRKGRFSKIKLA